jgi:hypothetical protein
VIVFSGRHKYLRGALYWLQPREERSETMSEQTQLPSEQEFNGFVGKLREFRGTLPQQDQRMLDAMVQAAFKTDNAEPQGDVQGYWYSSFR